MNKPEISTPNEVKKEEAPHLTEAEIEQFQRMSRLERSLRNLADWNHFQKVEKKPRRTNKPLKFNEAGRVVENPLPNEAPFAKGNVTKGTLRNKKCSCGSGKKYKICCLRSKYGA